MLEMILEKVLEYLVPTCELMGVFVVFVTVFKAFYLYLRGVVRNDITKVKYGLAFGLALSLEFKMAAEILKTVIVRDMKDLMILGVVILLRALMSLLIHFGMRSDHEDKAAPKKESEKTE